MAQMIQVPYDYSIIVPSATAQAVQEKGNENPISLEALGLLVNLLSYPTKWELHKTELYKRFGKNKETSVKSAWNDLMNANYIIEFKYRSGRKWEFVYYFRKVPFTSEEKAEILANAEKEYGEIWGLDFQDLKMETSKPRGNQKTILNKDPIQNFNNNNIDNIDDDKRTFPTGKDSAIHNEESINSIIHNFREATKDELSDRSFKAIVRKVVDKYNQGKVTSFRDYLATALTQKIEELELRRQKNTQTKLKPVESQIKEPRTNIPKAPKYTLADVLENM
ncbi:hypothetical protein AS888_00015 [Peribacillus simplex]|uniref:Uncharacterized protein n=1 Tax=Peribacillus simplex TaxID=1478 RepID=A0A109N3B0_9BACI|nr:hypothetical protein [Peribacillus simplex]KWW22731.1 hypothetical protein AS888_00015 [Peribacillus simplex]